MTSAPQPSVSFAAASPAARDAAFTALYDAWFDHVVRWLRAMGTRPGDVEDVAQEVFLVVHRRLEDFRGETPGPWLYAIALRASANHRRLAFVRNLVFKPAGDATLDRQPDARDQPAESLEKRQLIERGERVLAAMKPLHRRAFVLFEVEEYSGDEIAALEGIPVATVWTRLHHARRLFAEGLKKLRAEEERP